LRISLSPLMPQGGVVSSFVEVLNIAPIPGHG
jgi:hypothetical protein